MNHGCNGTTNYGSDPKFADDHDNQITETNFGSTSIKDFTADLINDTPVYSPVYERHLQHLEKFGDLTLRSIKKGEEIVTDYLEFSGDADSVMEDSSKLRGWCSGETAGDITEFEEK
jgi:hypothetical protein